MTKEQEDECRVKILSIDLFSMRYLLEEIAGLDTGGTLRTILREGLPRQFKVVSIHEDWTSRSLSVMIQSPEFPIVGMAECVPPIFALWERIEKTAGATCVDPAPVDPVLSFFKGKTS